MVFLEERMASVARDLRGELRDVFVKADLNERMSGWKVAKTDEGTAYYYNEDTKESQWGLPNAARFYVPPLLLSQFNRHDLKSIRKRFKLYDQNCNGAIDAQEIKLCLRDLRIEISHSRLQFLMKAVDMNGSGEIDFDEFMLFIFGIRRGRISLWRFLLATLLGCDKHPNGLPEKESQIGRLYGSLSSAASALTKAKVVPLAIEDKT